MIYHERSSSVHDLLSLIRDAKHIVFFGGAGVSTESGIPDFRSVDGLYSQSYDHPPETMLSRSFFDESPKAFFRFYRDKLLFDETAIQPNAAHRFLADLERQKLEEGGSVTVVTQNIDGLHTRAGSVSVCELHGSIYRNFCMTCHAAYPMSFIRDSVDIPRCPACGGIVKPDVVLYEEALDEKVCELAAAALCCADLLIVGGTSMKVYPAAGMLRHFNGGRDRIAVINRDSLFIDQRAGIVIHDSIGSVFSTLSFLYFNDDDDDDDGYFK